MYVYICEIFYIGIYVCVSKMCCVCYKCYIIIIVIIIINILGCFYRPRTKTTVNGRLTCLARGSKF
jgi:hypothetical protein